VSERGDGPQPLRSSLDRLTRGLGAPDSEVLTRLFSRWDELVGGDVAAHAQPLSLLRGTLVVGVDAPAWATHLRYLEADLVSRLEGVLGAGQVARVEVRVHPR
jgi:predicted nucleic acid-binding Zn ribbon protein